MAEIREIAVGEERVVKLAQQGERHAQEAVVRAYKPLIEVKARGYFIPDGDHGDLVAAGFYGLIKAIGSYSVSHGKFRTFADQCITRQIISAVRSSRRCKHRPLNESLPIHGLPAELLTVAIREDFPFHSSPGDACESSGQELPDDRSLTDVESAVLRCYLAGMTYAEMSAELQFSKKKIDNALQRIRKKSRLNRD